MIENNDMHERRVSRLYFVQPPSQASSSHHDQPVHPTSNANQLSEAASSISWLSPDQFQLPLTSQAGPGHGREHHPSITFSTSMPDRLLSLPCLSQARLCTDHFW